MINPTRGGNGEKGSVEFYIADESGGKKGPYKTSYQLRVVKCDVRDENEDGIYEFGESIVVQNIRVKNEGD